MVARYLRGSAAPGIHHVVKNVYGPIYQEIIRTLALQRSASDGFRILEYGCGGAMNLIELVERFHSEGARLEFAVGTDFSPPMIEAARSEARRHLPAEVNANTTFCLAQHEMLTQDLASHLGTLPSDLHNSFDLLLSVNTFRYAYRVNKDQSFARELRTLLRPGGYSIMIDLNRSCRFVGSRTYDLLARARQRYYVPSLRQYARAFENAGFVITEARTFFCFTYLPLGAWMPRPMEAGLLSVCRRLRPAFDACLSPLAQHSLIIAQKPITAE